MNGKMWKWLLLWSAALLFITLALPGMLVQRWDIRLPARERPAGEALLSQEQAEVPAPGLTVPVWISAERKVRRLPLEYYVRGVVAAEMPPEFALEALKAQAIAARTYIVHRLLSGSADAVPAGGAVVTDTVAHQAYVAAETLSEEEFQTYTRAVLETKGLIAIYQGRPINAVFFSTSNGYTENSEDYWNEAVPYLRSVPSPWDRQLSPKYKTSLRLPLAQFYEQLGLKPQRQRPDMRILARTRGGRIKELSINGHAFTGREVREKLGLASADFAWTYDGDSIVLTAYGYGHGVGMSQWGANGMAREGKTAEEIIRYYFTGVDIARLDALDLPLP